MKENLNNFELYGGLAISRHCIKDLASKGRAWGSLTGWEHVSLSAPDWIARLETGQTIQPSEFEPKADGKYTHNKALWRGTHFICADADNIKGVDFDDDGNDLNSNGVEGWTEPNALSNRYPELVDTVYAVGESVSSMAKEPLHRRYRLIFIFDELMTSAEQYHNVLLQLAEKFPIIPAVTRSPAQPVFGNARDNGKFVICGNILKLADFQKSVATTPDPAPKPKANSTIEKRLDEWLGEHGIPFQPTGTPDKYWVTCPYQDRHASGKNTPTDAYVFDDGNAWAFHCSHASCQQAGRSKWDAFKNGYGITSPSKPRGAIQQPVSESVPVPEPIPVEHVKETTVEFPLAAFGEDVFFDYWKLYDGLNEVCPAYHFAGLLSVVSSVLGRRVYLADARPMFPIFYQCLIGDSTVARKTTAVSLALDLLRNADKEIITVSKINSPEGFTDLFDTSEVEDEVEISSEGQRVFLHIDEMKGFFVKARQKATSGNVPMLTELYGGIPEVANNTRQNKTKGLYPYCSIVGCSTYRWLESGITIDDIEGGFANRFVYYHHEQMPFIAFPETPDENKLIGIATLLRNARDQFDKQTLYRFDDSAKEAYAEIYNQSMESLTEQKNDIAVTASQRLLVEYTKKLALVFSVLDSQHQDHTVTVYHLERALLVYNYWEAITQQLFSKLSVNEHAAKERLFLDKLAALGNNARRRELQRKVGNQMSAKEFTEIFQTHLVNGVIEEYKPEGSRKKYVARVEA